MNPRSQLSLYANPKNKTAMGQYSIYTPNSPMSSDNHQIKKGEISVSNINFTQMRNKVVLNQDIKKDLSKSKRSKVGPSADSSVER